MKKADNARIDPEQVLVAGMIFSIQFFHEMARLKKELMSSIIATKTARMVVGWCFDYCEKYSASPKAGIVDVKNLRMNAAADDEDLKTDIELASRLIDVVLESFDEDENWLAWADHVFKYIKRRKIQITRDRIDIMLDAGDIDSAEEMFTDFRVVQKQSVAGISLVSNIEDVLRIVSEPDEESVLDFHGAGAFGDLIGPCARGDLIAFVSPAKRGKSWWLQECAIRAMKKRKTVVFYSLEMSEKQMIGRIAQGLTRSLKMTAQPRIVEVPYFDTDGFICKKQMQAEPYTHAFLKKFLEKSKMVYGDIHVCCYPQNTLDVQTMKAHLSQLENERGIVPDVIIVDYADIMAAGVKAEHRHQIDHIWKMLRSLAQERNALVITASHSNKSTFNKDMSQEDISEDARKLNHVSCMIGLNQRNNDKTLGIMRAVTLAQRHDSFNPDNEVVVLYDYNTGRPLIDSKWAKDTNYASIKNVNKDGKK
jgi:archaellum biogenesis ATPase FlaH